MTTEPLAGEPDALDEELRHAEEVREIARQIAREEIASLAGLVLRRMQDDPHAPLAQKVVSAFAEALRDFGGTTSEPGGAS